MAFKVDDRILMSAGEIMLPSNCEIKHQENVVFFFSSDEAQLLKLVAKHSLTNT